MNKLVQHSTLKQHFKVSCISFCYLAFQQAVQTSVSYSNIQKVPLYWAQFERNNCFSSLEFWLLYSVPVQEKLVKLFDAVPLCLFSSITNPPPHNPSTEKREESAAYTQPATICPGSTAWKWLKNEGHRTNPAHNRVKHEMEQHTDGHDTEITVED